MFHNKEKIKIMTWNIYLGASLAPLNNTTKEEVPMAVTQIYDQVIQTDFNERAKSIANTIKKEEPEFIGLQEVAEWTVKSVASKCSMNFLTILLRELCKEDLHYGVLAINKNFSWSLPDSTGKIISLINRDVILFRNDLPVDITNIQEKNYKDNLVIQIGGEPFTLLRGYSSADIRLCNNKFRFVNTRLEASEDADVIRLKQSQQLIGEIGGTSLPIFLSGSFSILPSEPIYDLYIDAGFKDSWKIAGQGPGYTAFQASNLLNPISMLSERFEYIFFRDDSIVKDIITVGDQQKDRTPSGLWPSDHAGIVGEFHLPTWA